MSCSGIALYSPHASTLAAHGLPNAGAAVPPFLDDWPAALRRMHGRWHQRRTLLELDEHLLGDIGITRRQAEREARKPFWQ